MDRIKIAIIGARAYTARELLRVLRHHPAAEVVALQARVDEPIDMASVFGELRGMQLPPVTEVDIDALPAGTQAAFLCLPHTVAGQFAAKLLDKGIRVFDLSADFRFRDHKVYEKVYGVDHPSPELNRKAIYGLPELNRANLIGAQLVACPGCYPTSVVLATAPLMRADMVGKGTVIADCKSGVSGAGRTPSDTTHYCNVNESFSAYKVASHRHQWEIEEQLTRLSGQPQSVTFVPHLLPMERGILATVYTKLVEPIDESAVRHLYEEFYQDEPFVTLLPPGVLPTTGNVARSNRCEIQIVVDAHCDRLIVLSAIDNLVKGASGQGVQCMNISYGIEETTGLV